MVLIMSKILPTEISNMIPTGRMPTIASIVDKTITPAPGTTGVPIEAKREVMVITRWPADLIQLKKVMPKRRRP